MAVSGLPMEKSAKSSSRKVEAVSAGAARKKEKYVLRFIYSKSKYFENAGDSRKVGKNRVCGRRTQTYVYTYIEMRLAPQWYGGVWEWAKAQPAPHPTPAPYKSHE